MTRLTLFTSGRGAASVRALHNLRAILADTTPGPEVRVIDVDLHEDEAIRSRVFVTPYLRVESDREHVVIGTLDDRELIRSLLEPDPAAFGVTGP